MVNVSTETGDTTGWHRKWVILLGILGWLFLYRYRAIGWLLSKFATFKLSKSNSKLGPVIVHVERVSLQPLSFIHVEISGTGSNCFRVVLSRVELQTHVKEFFESFGQVKICILVIDEIIGEVDKVDEELLQEALLPKRIVKTAVSSSRSKMNPISYLRFVDLKVQSIRLHVHCMETRTSFSCVGLYAGITDVFVQREIFQLKVQAKSTSLQSLSFIEDQLATNRESDGSDGLRVEIPNCSGVMDLNLRNQRFLGCKITGCEEQTANFVMSTAFLERTLTVRNEIIRKALDAADVNTDDVVRSGESAPAVVMSSDIELISFHFSITVVNEVETIGLVPMQFCANVRKLNYVERIEPSSELKEGITAEKTSHNEVRAQVEALIHNVRVHNLASNKKLLSLCSVEMRAKQTGKTRGVLTGTFEKAEIFLSHRTEKIFRYLMAAQDRVEKCQLEAKRMIKSTLLSASTGEQEKTNRISWDAELEITSWMLSFKAFANDDGTDDFTAYGAATSIQTPLTPVVAENGSSCIKRSIVVQHVSVDIVPNGLSPHSAVFGGTKLTLNTSLDPTKGAKTVGTSVKFEYVSINGLLPEYSGDPGRFPAIYLRDVKIDRDEKTTSEIKEVGMDIHVDNANVKWHYQQHKAFLAEWVAIKNIIDQLDVLLSSSSKKTPQPACDQAAIKIMSTNVFSKDTTIDVLDIPGVASLATFCLTESRVSHRATHLSIIVVFNAANAIARWGENPSNIEVANVSFQNRSSLGRQRNLTKVPIQSDIRCSSLKMHLRPQSRMLLLFLSLDQLTSGSSNKGDSANRSSVQGISFVCGTFMMELEGENSKDDVASVEFTTLGVKMTRCAPREITDSMVRLVQCFGREDLAEKLFSKVAHKVMLMEGTVSASAVSALVSLKKLVVLQDTELRFSVTDVEWNRFLSWDDGSVVPRTTSFDLSLLTSNIQLAMERKLFKALLSLVPILQEAFDTREASDENVESISEHTNFRLRYVGNFDIAFQNAELTCPYGDREGREQIGSKITRVLLGEVDFKLRQFQVLQFKCSRLRVMLEDVDYCASNKSKIHGGNDSLQLLFIPKVSVKAIIHWRQGIHYSGQLQYALSLEIVIGHSHLIDQPTHVPIADQTLVAMNWDCVYPWLICMITDDEYLADDSAKDTSDPEKRVQCIGIQWDVSVSLIQFAWWDTVTQDIGMLIVANEFLTLGVLRTDTSSDPQDKQTEWKLWEATVYLHLFRGYLLHAGDRPTDAETTPELLPFNSELSSNFSLETVGTSYRNTYTPDVNEDWDVLDDEVTEMYAPSKSTIFEKMHDEFVPIDHEFDSVSLPIVSKEETQTGSLPMLQISKSFRRASAAITPPRSPRYAKNWTQNIKNRLSRLKHRSASMDNLFLKDGSCPIQVDSMRLLWTIQTRDSVFYMVSTTIDNLRLLLDAKRNAGKVDGQSDASGTGPASPTRKLKRSSFRPPSFVSNTIDGDNNELIVEPPRFLNRRGSTRDTLLDLLQQGKLGMTQDDRESTSKSIDDDSDSARGSISEDTSDYVYDAPKATIAMKAYTVDIHDVQINVREENTRSNMLLASKHIHFEIGTDEGDTNTIANLTFDNVTAHVAPIDVDISVGVLWYSHSDVGSPSASTLLKQIMDECSLTTSYIHTQSTNATSTEVDLSFLQLSTDRHQFYQLMNVIRHVLLAPPSVARRPKRTYTPRTYSTEIPQQLEGSDITVFVPPPSTTNLIAPPTSTKKLHVLLEEELRNREIRTRGTASRSKSLMAALKAISFKVVGMQWKLRLSPEISGADHEFVGIRIQGFTGCHTYYTNHCTKLTLNLQWLEISNLHPGSSSDAFEDPTAVLKAKLLVDKRLESTSSSSSNVAAGNQKGMLVVRAESGPIVRVHGQKLRVLEVLEVSMFPEVSNMIVIQLAADFYELIYKFFFANISPTSSSSQNSEQVLFGRKSTYGPVSPTISAASSQKGLGSPFGKPRMPTTTSPQSLLRPLRQNSTGSTSNLQGESSSNVISAVGQSSPTSTSTTDEIPDESDSTTTDDCELFYVKYVRVGNVRLRINCNGFFMNLNNFDLDLPPYLCQSKLCTSKKLLQKFESHLKWFITKESASSGLSQFKNKLLKWTPSSDAKKEKNKKQDEDTAAANAQVLFGPYSGAST